jgi:uncharacterized protein with NRDE domain
MLCKRLFVRAYETGTNLEVSRILCTNRDEHLNRPTQKAHFHSFSSSLEGDPLGPILSGRDVQAGGSWLGINTAGRVAFL